MLVKDMTHDQIADWAAMRIRRMGYTFSCSNLTSAVHGEQPDVLGIETFGRSFLGEVKVSRSDFLADKKKSWRQNPEQGMGDFRVYITPKDLLEPKEIPHGWMLWEVHGKTKPTLKVIKGQAKIFRDDPNFGGRRSFIEYRNCTRDEYYHFAKPYSEKNYQRELSWMVKIMGRAIESGFEPNDFANNYQNRANAA